MELVIAKEVVIRDVFVLRVWRTGFGGLNGARRAIGLEDSNKDHRMGTQKFPRKLRDPKIPTKKCGSQNRAICPNSSSQCRAS